MCKWGKPRGNRNNLIHSILDVSNLDMSFYLLSSFYSAEVFPNNTEVVRNYLCPVVCMNFCVYVKIVYTKDSLYVSMRRWVGYSSDIRRSGRSSVVTGTYSVAWRARRHPAGIAVAEGYKCVSSITTSVIVVIRRIAERGK